MDRNELAARFAVADYGAKCRAYYAGGPKGPGPDVYSGTAEDAFKMADLFLDYAERIDARPAKSTLTPAPVAPPAPTPSPEAKRPTHVRVTRLAHSDRPATVGKVYEVVRWNYDGSPDVIGDNGSNMSLSKPDGSDEKVWPAWEPAPCPPPVEGSVATGHGLPMRDLVASTIYHSLGGVGTLDALIPESRRTYLRTADAVLALLPEVRP